MNGFRRSLALTGLLAAAGGLAGLSAGLAQPQADKLDILVDFATPGPAEIAFDGGPPFKKRTNQFYDSVERRENATLHDVAVDYNLFEVPLRLLASPQRRRPIQFSVITPEITSCDRGEVNKIAWAAPSGTVDQRVALLIKAHRLIGLCDTPALRREVPKLVRKYYDVSCSLAGGNDPFFAIHRDATERFEALPRTQLTAKTLRDCRGRGVGPELGRTYRAAQRAVDRGDSAAVARLTGDLLAKSSDPAWQGGFEAQEITAGMVRELRVMDLKAQQNAAAGEGDYDRAIEINDRLQELRGDPEYETAFGGVNEELLVRERSDFEARLEMMEE